MLDRKKAKNILYGVTAFAGSVVATCAAVKYINNDHPAKHMQADLLRQSKFEFMHNRETVLSSAGKILETKAGVDTICVVSEEKYDSIYREAACGLTFAPSSMSKYGRCGDAKSGDLPLELIGLDHAVRDTASMTDVGKTTLKINENGDTTKIHTPKNIMRFPISMLRENYTVPRFN